MRTAVVALTVVVVGAAVPVQASELEGPTGAAGESFGVYYGDGLRHLAEGDHAAAVRALFRAYGLEPSAEIMELIVEAYDRMGHCGAAARQLDFFERHHDDQPAPELGECAETGELTIDCGGDEAGMIVGGAVEVDCGETVDLPAGRVRRGVWKESGETMELEVEAGERRDVQFGGDEPDAEVARIPVETEFEGEVSKLPFEFDETPEVPRLTLPEDFDPRRYRIFETTDGLYEVWRAAEGAEGPEGDAEVDLVCPDDAPDGETDEECLWLREKLEQQD